MITFRSLEEITDICETAVALGNFDGVHLGHQEIIRNAVKKAKELGLKSAVFTFSNHPRNLIPGKKEVKNIIYKEEKAALIESFGVDYLFDIPFVPEIMTMEPERYVKELLIDRFNAKTVTCGFNYRFGFKASGNVDTLKALGEKFSFSVTAIPPVTIDGEVVSSTLIRELIKSGDVDECDRFLGRNYSIEGTVVVGNRLGKSIGFPTSNITIDETMVTPPNGVYITYCIYNGVKYPSITNVGIKPTIGSFAKNMETHIFDFNKELYGKNIRVEFVKMMRPEYKFSSIDELVAEIRRNCVDAKAYHAGVDKRYNDITE
ncbi:MAG: bifunctional riboflavin kinase/FAD synthetase [Clostridia bacterium]|nr:bifunctional riboflavin kinase/FAD synthetase [Clostridia bacterium]